MYEDGQAYYIQHALGNSKPFYACGMVTLREILDIEFETSIIGGYEQGDEIYVEAEKRYLEDVYCCESGCDNKEYSEPPYEYQPL